MRDKRTPKDVRGEASFLCAQVSSGNRETMELLKICSFDPKALEKCENFNVSNVGYRVFSLTWPASMQIVGTKESVCIRKEFNSHRIG